jgi:hypothetical protein
VKASRASGLGYIVAVLANVVIPHLPASPLLHWHTRGVIRAVAVNLPLMSVLTFLALRDGWVHGRKALFLAPVVPIGIAAMIPLFIGRLI